MSATTPIAPSLRPLLFFLQYVLLIGMVAVAASTGPARAADDCSSLPGEACLRETISGSGTARVLSVNVLRQNQGRAFFNVIIPGVGQIKVEPGGNFALPVPSDGKVTYSIQACSTQVLNPSICTKFAQIVRSFGDDGSACKNQGLVAVGGSPGCYCPANLVNSGTGLPAATNKNQCVTPQSYNLAHACRDAGLLSVPGTTQCMCPMGSVNSGTGLPTASSKNQCITAQAYNALHPNGLGGGAQTATALNGTTIYKQPNGDERQSNVAGYVDPGGKVTIVSCNGNFCNISAPKAGWVWHEDIGR